MEYKIKSKDSKYISYSARLIKPFQQKWSWDSAGSFEYHEPFEFKTHPSSAQVAVMTAVQQQTDKTKQKYFEKNLGWPETPLNFLDTP